jgi:hypothetical protein
MESSLSLSMTQIQAEIGAYLGYGRGASFSETAWTTRQQTTITVIMNDGLRNFYYPQPLPGESQSYDWSFLRPTKQFQFLQNTYTVDLSDDFGGMEGDIRLVGSNRRAMPIKQSSEQVVRQQIYNFPSQTGQPEVAAVIASTTTTAIAGQRFQLLLFPMADVDYTLEFQYYVNPDSLTTTFPFALGGSTHAQTVKASCLAAAETYQDNMKGVMNQEFLNRLQASISLDRRNKGQSFGINDDPGFNRGIRYNRDYVPVTTPITYSGVTPG